MTPDETGPSEDVDTAAPHTPEKVPETAENFEHALRRIVRQKAEQRARHPGLYR